MFTGIIKEIGVVKGLNRVGGKVIIEIKSEKIIKEIQPGSSVAIDGVCQTVVKMNNNAFFVEAVEETLKKTTLSELNIGKRINLEDSLKLSDGLGGHLVLGHIDGVGKIVDKVKLEGSWLYKFSIPQNLSEFLVEIGSIAVDGISLTIAKLEKNIVTVSIIPFTIEHTTLGEKNVGEKVNIETDIIGKYVKNFLEKKSGSAESHSKITQEWLKKMGF